MRDKLLRERQRVDKTGEETFVATEVRTTKDEPAPAPPIQRGYTKPFDGDAR